MSLLTSLAFRQWAHPCTCLPMQQSSRHQLAGKCLLLILLALRLTVYLLPVGCRAAPAIQQLLLSVLSVVLLQIARPGLVLSFSMHWWLWATLQSATGIDLQPCCREVLVMVMRKHQRYFPVFAKGSSSQLLPHFITVANSPVDPDVIQASPCCILPLDLDGIHTAGPM